MTIVSGAPPFKTTDEISSFFGVGWGCVYIRGGVSDALRGRVG